MKKKPFFRIITALIICGIFAGCGKPADTADTDIRDKQESTGAEEPAVEKETDDSGSQEKKENIKEKKTDSKDKNDDRKSLAQRMAGKYSYHNSDGVGNEEFYIMDVVPFGDNIYAFCGQAMPEDYESLEAYSFWAAEFIPYDADEVRSADGDSVTVNELCFSVMSNAGKYWDAGHKGTITCTDDGLVFEGFDHDGFLVPENDDSRLFLKDDRVESAFGYLINSKGKDDLEGLWKLNRKSIDLYIEFAGSNMYIYSKDPSSEVFYAAGGCDYYNGSFDCLVNCLGYGGASFELNCDYETDGDTLTLSFNGSDTPELIPAKGKYTRIKPDDIRVITMDEIELNSESFGYYAGNQSLDSLRQQDYYAVFISAQKDREKCTPTINKLEEAGLIESYIVYTPDFSGLNPEPYYVVTTGLYLSENDAKEELSKIKAAGFADAYVKYAGSYVGDRYWYTMTGTGNIEVLKDGVLLRGVSVSIPYYADGESLIADLLVTEDTVFDRTAELEYFGNYEKGDSPYKWIVRNYNLLHDDIDQYMMNGPALVGIFEVGLDNNKITAYYGSYWWD